MAITIQGEIALPTNPNGICYVAEAREVLGGRSWLDVQRAAWSGLERFYSASGIDAVAWFGRRVALDRKNLASTQVMLLFVFDGPATRAHLDLLDDATREHIVPWSSSSVDPLPRHAFPSLCIKSGKFYQLWTKLETGPRALSLSIDEGQVVLAQRRPEDSSHSDFLPYVRHVLGARPKLRDADIELEQLKVAFALFFSEKIVQADGVVDEGEVAFLEKVFPAEMLHRMGLDHPDRYRHFSERACKELPSLLGHHEKLALVGLFFAACHSDGMLEAREMSVLREAADILGVERNEVVEYLRRIW